MQRDAIDFGSPAGYGDNIKFIIFVLLQDLAELHYS